MGHTFSLSAFSAGIAKSTSCWQTFFQAHTHAWLKRCEQHSVLWPNYIYPAAMPPVCRLFKLVGSLHERAGYRGKLLRHLVLLGWRMVSWYKSVLSVVGFTCGMRGLIPLLLTSRYFLARYTHVNLEHRRLSRQPNRPII